MTEDDPQTIVRFETRTVRAIRGMEARTISKWEEDGWEFVAQSQGRLRTEIIIRRPVPTTHRGLLIGGGAVIGAAAITLIVLGATGVLGDEAPSTRTAAASRPVATAAEPTETPRTPDSSPSSVPASLTADSNPELAAVLRLGDSCDPSIQTFAQDHAGQTISFDGSIGAMAPHGSTRYDILIGAGDYSETEAAGPAFQFRDVNTVSDLHYVGDVPDAIGRGTNIRVTAQVGTYDPRSCLLFLTPVQTAIR